MVANSGPIQHARKPFFQAVLIGLAATALVSPACAEITVNILQHGFGGMMKRGEWNPVTVEVSNQGGEFSGTLEIQPAELLANKDAPKLQLPRFTRAVNLPSRSTKRFCLYLSKGNGMNEVAHVRLLDERGKVIWKGFTPIILRTPEGGLVLAIGNDGPVRQFMERPGPENQEKEIKKEQRGDILELRREGLEGEREVDPAPAQELQIMMVPVKEEAASLQGQKVQPKEVKVGSMDEDFLPDHWAGYDAASVVFLFQASPGNWRPQEAQAIENWVAAGGTLAVAYGGRIENFSETFLARMLPVELLPQETEVPAGDFQVFGEASPAAPVRIAATRLVSGRALAGLPGRPFVAERSYGAGRVVFLAFNPRQPVIQEWTGRPRLVEYLLQTNRFAEGEIQGQAFNALRQLDELKQPPFWHIGIFLFAAILCIGPANFLVLRHHGRKEWMFATVPILSILFAFAGYRWTLSFKGVEGILKRYTAICLSAESPKARVSEWTGFLSPGNAVYTLTPASPAIRWAQSSLFPHSAMNENSLSLDSFRWESVQGFNVAGFVPEPVEIGMWKYQVFHTEDVIETGPLEIDLEVRDRKIEGTVKNSTPWTLQINGIRTGRLLYQGTAEGRSFSLQPGQVYTVSVDTAASEIQKKIMANPQNLRNLSSNYSHAMVSSSGQPSLVIHGIIQAPWKASFSVRDVPVKERGEVYFYAVGHLKMGLNPLYYPPGTIQGRVTDFTQNLVSFNPSNGYARGDPGVGDWITAYMPMNSAIEFSYPIPHPALKWKQLWVIAIPITQQQGLIQLEAWNPSKKEWRAVISGEKFSGDEYVDKANWQLKFRVTAKMPDHLYDLAIGLEESAQ